MKRAFILALVLGLATVMAGRAEAQFESALLSKLQLNLVNPGGKSQAMGGAFVSLADDPTAAIANPAGLWQLQSWQVGFSGKNFWYQPTLESSIYKRQDSSQKFVVDPELNLTYEPSGSAFTPEFFSVAGPVTENITMAAYAAVNLRYRIDAYEDDIVNNYKFVGFVTNDPPGLAYWNEEGEIDIRNTVVGVSAGGKFGRFSVGAGVTVNNLTFDLNAGEAGRAYLWEIRTGATGRESGVDDVISVSVENQNRVGFVIGARYEVDEKYRVTLGGVYRNSPSWDLAYTRVRKPTGGGASTTNSCAADWRFCGTFKLPDDFSIGLSGMPVKNLILAFEAQRIQYSQLNEGFVPMGVYTIDPTLPGTGANRAVAQGENDDVTVFRIGAEYSFLFSSSSLSVRAGYYYDPAHAMKMRLYPDADEDRRADPGSSPVSIPNPSGFPTDVAYATNFNGGEAQNHFTFGLGASFGRMFSFDLAADIASQNKSAIASLFLRF